MNRFQVYHQTVLNLNIREDTTFKLLSARAAKLRVDLRRMYNGEDEHDDEHQQRIEDVQIGFVRDEIAIVAWTLYISTNPCRL